MKRKIFSAILLLVWGIQWIAAQEIEQAPTLRFGVFGGANYHGINGLPGMIYPENYYSAYDFVTKDQFGGVFGIFVNYKPLQTPFAIQPEIAWSMQHTQLDYSDINGLHYTADFNYNYLMVGLTCKAYFWNPVYLSVSPQLAFNLTPEEIYYHSNGESMPGMHYVSDLEEQQLIRGVIKGRTDFSLGVGLGCELIKRKLHIDARYYFGLSDAVETLPNSYRFTENTNRSRSIRLTIGYAFHAQ